MTNAYSTQSEAERRALSDWRTGFLSNDTKAIYKNSAGQFVVVCDSYAPQALVVSRVYRNGKLVAA